MSTKPKRRRFAPGGRPTRRRSTKFTPTSRLFYAALRKWWWISFCAEGSPARAGRDLPRFGGEHQSSWLAPEKDSIFLVKAPTPLPPHRRHPASWRPSFLTRPKRWFNESWCSNVFCCFPSPPVCVFGKKYLPYFQCWAAAEVHVGVLTFVSLLVAL